MSKRAIIRVSILGVAFAILAIVLVPFLSAERYRTRVEDGLERLLQRGVSIGDMRFTLWGGPGFTLSNVVIADLPSISAEPFAYVNEARVGVSVSSLWRAELVFSSIVLSQPSVNIAQAPNGSWNYEQMLRRSVGVGTQSAGVLPEVVVREGRINFRSGLKKSIYYFRSADLRLAEEGQGTDAWLLEFRAEPARTDSFAPRFGTVRGRGRWRAAAGRNGELAMDVEIERSPLAEIASLFRASRVGLSGFLSARAHISGPAEALELRGTVELSERGEWGIFALPGESAAVPLRGIVDLPERRLHLEVAPVNEPASASKGGAPAKTPADGMGEASEPTADVAPAPRFEASIDLNPASSPGEWVARVGFAALPVDQVIALLRYLDDSFPEYPQLAGSLSGEVGYSGASGLLGKVNGDRLVWQQEGGARFALRDMAFRVKGEEVEGRGLLDLAADEPTETVPGKVLPAPTPPELADSALPAFGFSMDRQTGRLHASIEGKSLEAAHFDAIRQVAPAVRQRPPLLEGGRWRASGNAVWQRTDYRDPGGWFAQVIVRGISLPVAGVADPVVFQTLPLTLRGNSWKITGATVQTGKIRYRLDATSSSSPSGSTATFRPLSLRLAFNELSLKDIEAQLRLPPQVSRGFLSRTFSLGNAGTPPWLRNRSLAAKVYIQKVLIGNSNYRELSGDLYWDGASFELRNISMTSRFGLVKGHLRANLANESPEWYWTAQGRRLPWRGGEIDFDDDMSATGPLEGVLERVSGSTELTWRRPANADGGLPSLLRAKLRWLPGVDEPNICQTCAEFRTGGDVWLGGCSKSNGTGYRCTLDDPRTGQKREINLPMSLVGLGAN